MPGSRLTALILIAAAGATLAGFMAVGPMQHVGGWFGQRHRADRHADLRHMASELGLDDHQSAAVRGVIDQHRGEMKAARLQVEAARAALRQAEHVRPLNEGAVRAAADDLGRAIGERAVLRGRIGSEVRQVLTADQAARLDSLRAQREKHMAERREKAAGA